MRKKQNKATVRQRVWSELNKLFDRYLDGAEGWTFSKQSRWRPIDIFQRLVQAALEETSLEDVCSSFEGCSADTVHYRITKLGFMQVVRQLNDLLRYTAQGFHIHGKQKLTLAIDITDYPWYGDRDHELSVGSKPKSGTHYFQRYFTACILYLNKYLSYSVFRCIFVLFDKRMTSVLIPLLRRCSGRFTGGVPFPDF